ncbi:MAG TPA: short-chain dehydrogenase/reductase [Acetobacteraceae bacterium]|jgi:NAD(P)-dependent dehydrogenase (short-subunit alcohol dehydrogenase family)|nr:short-chain dehydrogenase/reductase [Acetobacteraceae bacterium]
MDLHLAGKRALITGGSKGIGRASAGVLAEEGTDLVLVARDRAGLEEAAAAIRAKRQVRVEVIPADLSRQAEVERVAEAAGPVDILVNNAGAIPPGNLLTVDDATLRAAWDLKVFGFISLTRALYPTLRERRGVIVNVIGAAGETFDPGYIAGVAGNAALMAFTRGLGRGGHKDGIRVVAINPGPVATQRMERLLRHRAETELGDAGRWRDLCASMPYGRPAEPEEIGAAVAFLASPRSAYTNGTVLTINGGP